MKEDKPSTKRVRLYDEPLPAVPPTQGKTIDNRKGPDGLSAIEERFCRHYTSYYEPTKAAIWAGYTPGRAGLTAHKLLSKPSVKLRIAAIEADRLRRLKFDGDLFLARELTLAQADVTELIEAWIPPCRYCWGRNFEYQRTHAEFQEDFEAWCRMPDQQKSKRRAAIAVSYGEALVYDGGGGKIPFDQKGGDGYDPSQPPNPACPNCHGRGNENPEMGTIPYIRLKDSRYLSDTGRILYAGMENTQRGVKQLLQNQDAARHRLMTMMGHFLELRSNSPTAQQPSTIGFELGLAPEVAGLLTDDPRSMTDAQLDALLAKHGVVIYGAEGEGEGSGSDRGEAPPPGRIA